MPICDEVRKVVSEHEKTLLEEEVCQMYEKANESFQDLINRGIAYKRGYQLSTTESKICNGLEFNVGCLQY